MLKIPVSPADHLQGDPAAPITLLEYGDYQCPHCAHAYPIVKRIQKHFGNKLAFVFRNFPLNEIHPVAEAAAETAEFAATHHKFWEMHDAIFENQPDLSPDLLLQLAQQLKLPLQDLQSAWSARTFQKHVRSDFTGGIRSGVNGTPTFFINATRHEGPFEYENLLTAITAALTTPTPPSP